MQNEETKQLIEDIESYTDAELNSAWDHLESLKLTDYVAKKMDEIHNEMGRRSLRQFDDYDIATIRRMLEG